MPLGLTAFELRALAVRPFAVRPFGLVVFEYPATAGLARTRAATAATASILDMGYLLEVR
jgi:hypothetical protein